MKDSKQEKLYDRWKKGSDGDQVFLYNCQASGEENREEIACVSLLISFNPTDGSRWINFI